MFFQLESDELRSGITFIVKNKKNFEDFVNTGSKNSSGAVAVSLYQQVHLLQGVLPAALQVNALRCTLSLYLQLNFNPQIKKIHNVSL